MHGRLEYLNKYVIHNKTVMNNNDISDLPLSSLKSIAKKMNINISKCKTKKEVTKVVQTFCDDIEKFHDYTYIKQLGRGGKDGRTFMAKHTNGKKYAIKIFKKSKSGKRIKHEVELQNHASKSDVTVPVFDWSASGRFVAMDILDKTIFDLFLEQNGKLTIQQQKDIVNLMKRLDKSGVFHADPNPLNFMYKGTKLYAIDFGFSSYIDDKCIKKHGNTPNIKYMPLGMIIHFRNTFPDRNLKFTYLSKYIDKSLLN